MSKRTYHSTPPVSVELGKGPRAVDAPLDVESLERSVVFHLATLEPTL